MSTRLERLESYLNEALKEPEENKLYIADLQLSIKYFKRQKNKKIVVMNGLELEND